MPNFSSIWDVTPDTGHPRARELLTGQSFIWEYGNEDSPVGTDTGADTFAAYLDFRAHRRGVRDFIREQLTARGIPDADWDSLDEAQLEQALKTDKKFILVVRDDFIMGLAFAQILVEGTVNSFVRQRALAAIQRQATDVMLSFRGGGNDEGRKRQLASRLSPRSPDCLKNEHRMLWISKRLTD